MSDGKVDIHAVTTRSEHRCFGGVQGYYEHDSVACAGKMRFGVFVPPQGASSTGAKLPVLYFLAGLTCTEETFAIKAGAQRVAAELGIIIVTLDTSPRSARHPGDDASWDFGVGAGFYLDATQAPWSANYKMESYLIDELRAVVEARFPVDVDRRGICGHSMGGHGALTLALRHPSLFRSVSAFAPIVAPASVPWGEKAFSAYLGDDKATWRAHDACQLLEDGKRFASPPLIDQGMADAFLEKQLQPERFEAAATQASQPFSLRRHDGYDHGYFFIATVVADHLRHHAQVLGTAGDR